MTPFIREIAALSGGNVWLVGGFLRDALLGRPTADVDVVVDGDAGALAKRFARAPGRSFFPLDKERGTYRVSLSANLFRPPKLSTDHKELPSPLGRRCPEGADEGCAIFSLGNRIPHPALSQEERENRFRGLKRHLPSPQENVHFDFARLQGPTLEADLRRRDFTVNALALPASLWGTARWRANLLDPTGGVPDLAARRLRRVSPHAFREDPLRLLRAYRFSAELGFGLTPETVKDIRLHRRKLARSAPERVREELLRLLSTPRAAATLADMDRAGLLVVLFPELEPMRRTGRAYYGTGGVLAHSLAAVGSLEKLLEELPVQFPSFHGALSKHLNEPVGGHPRFAHLKLVELFHDIGKPATAKKEKGKLHFYGHDAAGARLVTKIAARLRLSSNESRSLSRQVGAHMRPGNLGHTPVLTDRAIYRFYRDLEGDAVGLLIVSLGDHFTYLSTRARRARKDPVFLTIRKMLSKFFLKPEAVEPPKMIDGNQLMKSLKLKPGPTVGRLLAEIREAQSTGEVTTPAQALQWARRLL